ncbi:MAG: hypothetical protein KC684_06110 [Candidatus Omnitrophica bacterium]|nr:hypothetical protein [Candidatus Omnitrophota bacterium]
MFLFVVFIVMLVMIGVDAGWKRALKIFGFYFLATLVLELADNVFTLHKSGAFQALSILLLGSFTVYTVIYNIYRGNIIHR